MEAITVNEAIEKLQAVANAGQGEHLLVVPYEPGRVVMGARAVQPVVHIGVGFDWDSGKVMLQTEEKLGPADERLKQIEARSTEVAETLYDIKRVITHGKGTEAERLERIKAMVQGLIARKPTVTIPV